MIYHDDIEIASFGIRRGSKKDIPHGHIPEALHIRPRQCLDLARCPLSRDEWIGLLRERGLISVEEDESIAEETEDDHDR